MVLSAVAEARAYGFPEGWQMFIYNKQQTYTDPTGTKLTSILEVRDALGDEFPQSLVNEMRTASDHGLSEGWRIHRDHSKRNFISPDGVAFNNLNDLREFLGELPAAMTNPKKDFPDGFANLVADALEAASSPQEAYAHIGLPAGWEVEASRRKRCIDLAFKSPTGKPLRGLKSLVEVLGGVPESMKAFAMQAKKKARADTDDNDETAESSKKKRIELVSTVTADGPTTQEEGYGHILRQGLDESSWNIIPHDVLCIDLDAIGKHIQMAGWECKSRDTLVHAFCNSGGSSLTLHSTGNLVVQSATKQDAEEIALLFANHWLTADA